KFSRIPDQSFHMVGLSEQLCNNIGSQKPVGTRNQDIHERLISFLIVLESKGSRMYTGRNFITIHVSLFTQLSMIKVSRLNSWRMAISATFSGGSNPMVAKNPCFCIRAFESAFVAMGPGLTTLKKTLLPANS